MVILTEVEDEHFQSNQPGPDEEEDFTDTGSYTHQAPSPPISKSIFCVVEVAPYTNWNLSL